MGFQYMSFLDAYKCYHQVQMVEEDEEKTAFYTDQGTNCYTKMHFGLKNTWATYQRLFDSAFQNQMGRNLEAYVDDVANPKKTKAIADMLSPRSLKEMQSLSGKLVALSRFLARSAEWSLTFFETLKNITKENKDEYRWKKEAKESFQCMKRLIIELPFLTTPIPKETPFVYLTASQSAVSGVLLAEKKGRKKPVSLKILSRTRNRGLYLLNVVRG
ncbi:reverse transcriptase domain-containing protein [Tanacetum coccineum]